MDFLTVMAFESPSLDLDITLLIQFGIFILLMIALYKFVMIPYFKAYDAREALTKGAQSEARTLEEAAGKMKAEYDRDRQAAYNSAETTRREAVAKANVAASELVEKARQEVQRDLAEKNAELERQLAEARQKAAPEIAAISTDIANKILV